MDQLLPNTYLPQMKRRFTRRPQLSIRPTLTLKQQVRRFFTAERGDTLTHPQMPADKIISLLNDSLSHHTVISVMLNASDPFARHLETVTGTLRNDQGLLTITNHGSGVTYTLLPEQIRSVGYGMMVA
ncbi:hypothetical protein [Furfurilactobacillus siliginis]|uniref:Uncharacterized protein n=1 Tax=Furfurilactobacillus siliginis TaxID=348151 RepID=A0A0R2L5E3_9LACO|nr:hypothetical protein [Furfurilactobacillus siliginis]KRN96883.1 hypothetical protein IV55_GL000755 [Furfurilactobacillus siliginis]GEK28079.1 hypothetical protein LSI01_03900 [Furfurilactobacillus siliginis]